MNIFKVYVRMEDGGRSLAGELAMEDPKSNGKYRSAFRYAPSWIDDPKGFALDPVSLPLRLGEFSGARLGPPLGFVEDALPDRWGRDLLLHALPRSQRSDQRLIELRGSNGMGAIEFESSVQSAVVPQKVSSDDLDSLLEAAEAFEAGREVAGVEFVRLLAAGSTPGGARPKAAVSADGVQWIAKFPSKILDGRFDIVALEKASMDCARDAGLVTPNTRVQIVGSRKVLLVERFDTTPSGRHHMLSFATACRERNDFKVTHYDELSIMLRRVSGEPAQDVAQLFRQAVFNGLLGNTDDHLKNFSLFRNLGQYRLTPAYDLLPDFARNGESTLFFGSSKMIDSMATIDAMAERWGVADHNTIVRQVIAAVSDFSRYAVAAGVPAQNVDEITVDITRRLQRAGAAFRTTVRKVS